MNRKTLHKTCNICEATCGLLVDVVDNRIEHIRADAADPFSRGHICPKAIGLRQILEDPDRLKQPVRRIERSGRTHWQPMAWDEALDEVATRLADLQARLGNDAVGTYIGNPAAHSFGAIMYVTLINQAIATRNRYSASSLDQNPKHASSLFLFGNILSIPIPDIDHTDFLLMLGANPVISGGSLMTAPGFARRIEALRRRGGRFVVVDPRRSETAALADEHIALRPGDDALFLCALLHTVFDEKLTRESSALALADGIDILRSAFDGFAPESVAGPLGVPATELRELARAFTRAPSAVCYGRIGTCVGSFGSLNSWLIDVLNLVTGNLDRRGGAMFPTPAADLPGLLALRGRAGDYDVWRTRVRGAPAFSDEQPCVCLAEELLTPGPGQIRGMLTLAGNPVLSAPNGAALDRGFAGLDFYAAIDFYINETTRHADIILPPTCSLESENYEILFHGFAVRNGAKYSPPIVSPGPDTRHEWQILSDLGLRIMARKAGWAKRLVLELLRRGGAIPKPQRALDWMLRIGPYGDRFVPWRSGLRFRDVERQPQGIDLGPLIPSLDRILNTESGRIDLAHPLMHGEIERLATERAAIPAPVADAASDLLLIGRREMRSNNSWFHNLPLSAKGGGGRRCTLLMHPHDATARSLDDGRPVRIRSRVGEVVAALRISDEIMSGVVSLPHGWGHDRPSARLQLASEHPGVNVNELCDDAEAEGIVGNAVFSGIPVSVEATDDPR